MWKLVHLLCFMLGCSSADTGPTTGDSTRKMPDRSGPYVTSSSTAIPCGVAGWYTLVDENGGRTEVYLPGCPPSPPRHPVSDQPPEEPTPIPEGSKDPFDKPGIRPGPPGDPAPF